MHKAHLLIPLTGMVIFAAATNALPQSISPAAAIVLKKDGEVTLSTSGLVRTLQVSKQGVSSISLKVRASELLAKPSHEFSLQFEFASPDRKPTGLKPGEGGEVKQSAAHFQNSNTDTLNVTGGGGTIDEGVQWINPTPLEGATSGKDLGAFRPVVTKPKQGVTRLTLRAGQATSGPLAGVSVTEIYEVYAGFPVVRKWMEVSNASRHWMKIDHFQIDDVGIAPDFAQRVPLTPAEYGVGSSLVGITNHDATVGLIAGSEVPSGMRSIAENGAMGYTDELFEWVLGPNESFTSEPVFFFGFSGEPKQLLSGVSTPLDRAVEGPLQQFLRERLGIASRAKNLSTPTWVTWSNLRWDVSDAIIRQHADIAAKAGFRMLLIDSGWQKANAGGGFGTEIDTKKFPDLRATSNYVRSKGMRFGLWLSDFRDPDSKDLAAMPDAANRPMVRRSSGIGMSFATPWRQYYAQDLVDLAHNYGISYFKQDLTNLYFGDAADGHESRTLKESRLRELRGLLETQDIIRREAPSVTTELSHEIYWRTPGAPCDLAAVEHADLYHTPPNDYSGADKGQPWDPNRKYDAASLHQGLIDGAYNARKVFYALRGLPLEVIEYYAAATFNGGGSLTPEIQDRQIASWLFGAPAVFAGELKTLTPENMQRYHDRFQTLARLESTYGIYEHFEFSGVPAPTDVDWHWWGKLNERGEGAVVVLRGSGGSDSRQIVVPWVIPAHRYHLKALFGEKDLGTFTGSDLIDGKLKLELPQYGQEIVEVSAAK